MTHRAAIVFQDGVTQFIQVKKNERLLDAAFRHGISLPLDCREGVCATCRGLCESGDIAMEYVDEDALTEAEQAKGYMLACQTTLKSAASFYFDIPSTVCNVAVKPLTGTVTHLEQVSEAASIIEITLDAAQGDLQYLPGQYARLHIPETDQHRAYSFAKADAASGTLRFLMRLLPTGVMSDYLRERCQVGDSIKLEAPFGAFYLRQIERPLLFVAGGTGLSAFLSMLEKIAMDDHSVPIRLCYGVNHEQDLSELARLDALKATLTDFDYSTVVMRPSTSWQGHRGVVCDIFDPAFLSQPFDAYLCGPPPMITATQNFLEAGLANQTVAAHQVYFEKFVSS